MDTRSSIAVPPEADVPRLHPQADPPGTRLGPHMRDCYACGDRNEHGLHLVVLAGHGVSVSAEFTVTREHQGAPGLAHGGLLAAAFDDAIGYVLWQLRRPSVTVRLETQYARPVPVGATLHIEARATGVQGRKTWATAEGHLDAPDGPVAVRAAALFVTVPAEHFTRYGTTRPEDIAAGGDPGRYNP